MNIGVFSWGTSQEKQKREKQENEIFHDVFLKQKKVFFIVEHARIKNKNTKN